MMSSMERLVLYFNVLCSVKLLRISSPALLTGAAVNKETTSNDTIISSWMALFLFLNSILTF